MVESKRSQLGKGTFIHKQAQSLASNPQGEAPRKKRWTIIATVVLLAIVVGIGVMDMIEFIKGPGNDLRIVGEVKSMNFLGAEQELYFSPHLRTEEAGRDDQWTVLELGSRSTRVVPSPVGEDSPLRVRARAFDDVRECGGKVLERVGPDGRDGIEVVEGEKREHVVRLQGAASAKNFSFIIKLNSSTTTEDIAVSKMSFTKSCDYLVFDTRTDDQHEIWLTHIASKSTTKLGDGWIQFLARE